MKYTYKIAIGDWSGDGHGKHDDFTFESSHHQDEIIKAYKEACKKSGIYMHGHSFRNPDVILADYEDNTISKDQIEKLEAIGIDFKSLDLDDYVEEDNELWCGPDDCAKIFLAMAKTQLAGFEYRFVEDKIPYINGYWSKTFNESIGYGCY